MFPSRFDDARPASNGSGRAAEVNSGTSTGNTSSLKEPLLRRTTFHCSASGSLSSRSQSHIPCAPTFTSVASSLYDYELHSEVLRREFLEHVHAASGAKSRSRRNEITSERNLPYLADDGPPNAATTQSLVYSNHAGTAAHAVREFRAPQSVSCEDLLEHPRVGRQSLSSASIWKGADGVNPREKYSSTSLDTECIACNTSPSLIFSGTSDSDSIIKLLSDAMRSVVDREARLESDAVSRAEQTSRTQQVATLPQHAATGVTKCPGPPPLQPLPPLPRPQKVLERIEPEKPYDAYVRFSMPDHTDAQIGTRPFHEPGWEGLD